MPHALDAGPPDRNRNYEPQAPPSRPRNDESEAISCSHDDCERKKGKGGGFNSYGSEGPRAPGEQYLGKLKSKGQTILREYFGDSRNDLIEDVSTWSRETLEELVSKNDEDRSLGCLQDKIHAMMIKVEELRLKEQAIESTGVKQILGWSRAETTAFIRESPLKVDPAPFQKADTQCSSSSRDRLNDMEEKRWKELLEYAVEKLKRELTSASSSQPPHSYKAKPPPAHLQLGLRHPPPVPKYDAESPTMQENVNDIPVKAPPMIIRQLKSSSPYLEASRLRSEDPLVQTKHEIVNEIPVKAPPTMIIPLKAPPPTALVPPKFMVPEVAKHGVDFIEQVPVWAPPVPKPTPPQDLHRAISGDVIPYKSPPVPTETRPRPSNLAEAPRIMAGGEDIQNVLVEKPRVTETAMKHNLSNDASSMTHTAFRQTVNKITNNIIRKDMTDFRTLVRSYSLPDPPVPRTLPVLPPTQISKKFNRREDMLQEIDALGERLPDVWNVPKTMSMFDKVRIAAFRTEPINMHAFRLWCIRIFDEVGMFKVMYRDSNAGHAQYTETEFNVIASADTVTGSKSSGSGDPVGTIVTTEGLRCSVSVQLGSKPFDRKLRIVVEGQLTEMDIKNPDAAGEDHIKRAVTVLEDAVSCAMLSKPRKSEMERNQHHSDIEQFFDTCQADSRARDYFLMQNLQAQKYIMNEFRPPEMLKPREGTEERSLEQTHGAMLTAWMNRNIAGARHGKKVKQ